MILSEKSWAPGGVPWAELKSNKHLRAAADCQHTTVIWCRFTYHLQFWIMTGIFYSWDRSIFQYQTMFKSSVELGLVYKTFVNKHFWNYIADLEKQTASTVHVTLGSSGSWTRLSFPYNQKHTTLETFFPSESRATEWSALMGALSRWSMCARVRSSGRNAHIRSSTVVYVSKSHVCKKLSETCTNPEIRFLAQKYSYFQIVFWNFGHAYHENPTF